MGLGEKLGGLLGRKENDATRRAREMFGDTSTAGTGRDFEGVESHLSDVAAQAQLMRDPQAGDLDRVLAQRLRAKKESGDK